jgi:hypothetical protein
LNLSKKNKIKSRIKNTILFFVFSIFVILISAYIDTTAQMEDGGYSQSYLNRGIGARAISMGGAYTAIVNEPSAIYYNPAGIGYLSDEPIINSNVSSLSMNRTHTSLMYGQMLSDEIGIGLGLNSLSSGNYTARDITGRPIGQLSDLQYNFAIAMAYRSEAVSFGATAKYLKNNLQGANVFGTGYAVDIGTKINIAEMFSFGMSVNNLNGMMFWNTELVNKEVLPYTIRTGFGAEFGLNDETIDTRDGVDGEIETVYIPATRYVLVGLDAVMHQYESSPRINLGLEIVPIEFAAFRAGMSIYGEQNRIPQLLPSNNWGAGISIRPNLKNLPFRLNLDYTINNEILAESGIAHSFGLIFEF